MVPIARRPWTRQPQGPARVNRSSPLTRGLEFLYSPGGANARDAASGILGVGTPAFEAGRHGMRRHFTGANQFTFSGVNRAKPKATGATSVFVFGEYLSSSSWPRPFRIQDGTPNDLVFIEQDGSAAYIGVRDNGGSNQFPGYPGLNAGINTPFSVGLSWVDGGTCELFGNGASIGTSTVTAFADTGATNITFSDSGDFGGYVFAVWNRSLSAAEQRSLAQNPWQLFVQTRRLLVDGSAAASGAIAGTADMAFAAGSSTLTGAGALAGSAANVFGAGSSTLTGGGTLAGSAALTFGGTNALTGSGALAGAAALTFAGTNTLTGTGALAGVSALVFGGSLNVAGAIAGTADMSFGAGSSALTGAGALAGAAAITFDALLTSAAASPVPSSNNFAGPRFKPVIWVRLKVDDEEITVAEEDAPEAAEKLARKAVKRITRTAATQTPAITVEGEVSRETKREIRATFRAEFNRDAGVIAAKALIRAQQEQEDEETLLWLI